MSSRCRTPQDELEQGLGTSYAEAMYIKGNNILFLGSVWSNYQGTWKVTNGKMEVVEFAFCDEGSSGQLKDSWTYTVAYAVRGDELFTMSDADDPKVLKRWKRVDDLCDTTNSFKC